MALRVVPSVFRRCVSSFSSPTPQKTLFSTTSDIVVNALGTDRPGIVSDLTKSVTDLGGSVGDSHSTKLGADFSLTMLIHVPSNSAESLKASLHNMEGMSINCIDATPAVDSNLGTKSKGFTGNFRLDGDQLIDATPAVDSNLGTKSKGFTGNFRLDGADNLGLVHQVTSVLAKHRLSIDEMRTTEEDAPYGGATLFHVDGIVTLAPPLPKQFDPDAIAKELRDLGESMNCDVILEDQSGKKKRPNWIWENLA
eukprot:CAMPEP_0197466626 /NCGR_PEP_ID=MMETSP1175-20131217/65152_1 /TAXON_ID=1003142 /ORGANISM="Triceratium dubium, Strain CCMP147" /LENGTH=252 /DNA_ID=CAMNT_0043002675 /DNA_START=46 /DNA_END=805 /DNA_ORIENTATION=+